MRDVRTLDSHLPIHKRLAQQYVPAVTYRGALADFIDDLQVAGRLTFTREEALAALGVSPGALKQAALRLSKLGRLVSPRRGYYVIVPLEHRAAGVPPLTSWLPDLLRFHGARGEGSEVEGGWTVVTVDRPVRPVECGPYRVRFRVQRG